MEITISGVLVRDDYPYLIGIQVCALHSKNISPTNVINLISEYIQSHQSYAMFSQIFNKFYTKTDISDLKNYSCAIYLIDYIISISKTKNKSSKIIVSRITTESICLEIKKISDKILLESFNKNISPDFHAKIVLEKNVEIFSKMFINSCKCEYTLRFDEKSVKKYGIAHRIDLVHKILTTSTFDNNIDIEMYIHNTLKKIRYNLRKVILPVINVDINKVPEKIKILLEKKQDKYIYYDSNLDIINPKKYLKINNVDIDEEFKYTTSSETETSDYYESSEDTSINVYCDIITHTISPPKNYVYLYIDEPDPKPIYKITQVDGPLSSKENKDSFANLLTKRPSGKVTQIDEKKIDKK
jgi:hypothetical protein